MYKLTSKEPISLRIDGTTVLEINEDGCLASDEHAAIAIDRLGETIKAVPTDAKKAVQNATGGNDDENAPKELTHAELKAEAKALGLPQSGSKDDLKARIAEHKAKPAEEPVKQEGGNEGAPAE